MPIAPSGSTLMRPIGEPLCRRRAGGALEPRPHPVAAYETQIAEHDAAAPSAVLSPVSFDVLARNFQAVLVGSDDRRAAEEADCEPSSTKQSRYR